MAGEGVVRRLAAILAADVVGYSRLVRADEEATLEALAALRAEVIEPLIARHNGRLFKLMGDGLLAALASVVDAARCAVAIQEAVAERHAAGDGGLA
jgi:adenylate cyclase